MNCFELEARLEQLVSGELEDDLRRRCARHLSECAACREIEALVRLAELSGAAEATSPPAGLLQGVLEQTTGDACAAAHERLCDHVDGRLSSLDSELMAAHLGDCSECHALAGALRALDIDLPRLADLQPGGAFVDTVLRHTLPIRVLARRWWSRAWPRWVQRPRFAAEAAYVATLVLALIFATPGSPLEAMPQRAVELARTAPTSRLTEPVESLRGRLTAGYEAARSSEAAGAVLDSWGRTLALGSHAAERSLEVAGGVKEKIRTLWNQAASLLQRADETPSTADENTDEETS